MMRMDVYDLVRRSLLTFLVVFFLLELVSKKPNENNLHKTELNKPHGDQQVLPAALSGEWHRMNGGETPSNNNKQETLIAASSSLSSHSAKKESHHRVTTAPSSKGQWMWSWRNDTRQAAETLRLTQHTARTPVVQWKSAMHHHQHDEGEHDDPTTTTTTPRNGFVTMFPKNVIRTENNIPWPLHSSTSQEEASHGQRIGAEYLVGAHVFLKIGTAISSSVSMIKMQGGQVAPGVWTMLGVASAVYSSGRGAKIASAAPNRSHMLHWFDNSRARMLSGVEAYQIFGEILLHNEQQEKERLAAAGQTNHSTGQQDNVSTSSSSSKPSSLTDADCFWYAQLRLDEATTAAAASSPLYTMAMLSSCGDALTITEEVGAYDAFAGAVRWVLVISGLLPMGSCTVALILQGKFMQNSRAIILRSSRVQFLLIGSWMSLELFLAQWAWTMFPTLRKLTNLVYLGSLGASIIAFGLFHIVDNERRTVENQPRSPNRTIVGLVLLLTLVNVIPVLLETRLFSIWSLYISALTFWLPQLVHMYRFGAKNSVSHRFIIGASLLPIQSFVGLAVMAGSYPVVEGGGSGGVPVFGPILVVVAEAAMILLANRYGVHDVLPRWLRPFRHRYECVSPSLLLGGADDGGSTGGAGGPPECTICTESLRAESNSSSGVVENPVWVTPCRHVFHAACLQQWMEQQMLCPLCRKVLPQP